MYTTLHAYPRASREEKKMKKEVLYENEDDKINM